MHLSLPFLRILFFALSIFFMTTYALSLPSGSAYMRTVLGLVLGSALGTVLIGFDILFRRFNLRSFNIAIVGLFVGYLMGEALVLILKAILDIGSLTVTLHPQTIEILKISLFLFGTYLGTLMVLKSSDEFYVSIPFVKFSSTAQKKKDLVLDGACLSDARLIDLAATGILDHHLVLPRFLIKELYTQAETGEEPVKAKAKKSLEVIKKLEEMESLKLRFSDTDFPEVKDPQGKLIRLARLVDANLLSADISRIQLSSIEGVKVINLHSLSNALKPLTQTGEYIKIKIQRYGKEPKQGVGYLEDGTMVVVNGGGGFIGETIDAQVLSVKHTSSGRMVFCNLCNGDSLSDEFEEGNSHDDYK